MNEDSLKHGAFSWVELMTTDKQAAKEFYRGLFNWETEEYPMEGVDYTVVKVVGNPVGGIMPVPPDCQGMAPSWYAYVTVDDVDAIAERSHHSAGNCFDPRWIFPKSAVSAFFRTRRAGSSAPSPT